MSANLLLVVLAAVANLGIGTMIFAFHPKSATSRFFFLLTVVATGWMATNYLSLNQGTAADTLIFARHELFAATAYSFAAFLTIYTFPSTKFKPRLTWFLPLAAVIGLVLYLTETPFFFKSLTGTGMDFSVTPGPGIPLFGLTNFGLIVASFSILGKRIKASHGVRRTQFEYLFIAVAVSNLAAFITNFVLVNIFHINSLLQVAPYLSLLFVGIMAYATIAHQLFDIRIIVKRTLIFATLLAFVFAVYTAFVVLIAQFFQSTQTTTESYLANLVSAIIIGASFEPLRKWISNKTDRWLFKKEYEQQSVITDLGKKLNDVVGLDEALDVVMQTITKVLHLHHAVAYVFQPAERGAFAIKRIKQIGYGASARLMLEDKDFTVTHFAANPKILLTDDLRLELERGKELLHDKKTEGSVVREHAIKQAVYKKLESLNVAAVIPLHLNSQPIGLIFLSEKRSGEVYRQQDLALLELVGSQAISSIQKAKLYEGDQMKSEFVSIASHELLTPISAIEGYLSMILEEHIGKVDHQAEEYLTKVYTSAKRLSALIKDLLSVSRIESGKLKVVTQQLDIDKSIKETVDQLKFMAEQKKLELIYHAPYEPLPPVAADPDRTAQVLVNLLSNAIKYSPQGSVTITPKLDKHAGMITVAVADTGLGMSKDAVQHLFSKFYRVDTPETSGIGGTGLGLYITKSIIEKMNGNITVKSTEGKGSVFTFTLPLFKVETTPAAQD